jgi:hypothetical protein
MRPPRFLTTLLLAGSLLLPGPSDAVILFRTGDATANTTEPAGPDYAGSGWQYEGFWGAFLGTPIAPRFFISAKHVGNAGTLVFQGTNYRVVNGFLDPASDLAIWQVAEAFPSFAPLYTGTNEMGQRLMAFGRGTRRGAALTLDSVPKGWPGALATGLCAGAKTSSAP